MANNRIYLTHVPSGLSLYLGSRNGWEWCGTLDLDRRLQGFFDATLDECNEAKERDDYAVSIEDNSNVPHVREARALNDPNFEVFTLPSSLLPPTQVTKDLPSPNRKTQAALLKSLKALLGERNQIL